MQIFHFNTFLSIVYGSCLIYAFKKGSFRELLDGYFGMRAQRVLDSMFDNLLSKLSGYQENIAIYRLLNLDTERYRSNMARIEKNYNSMFDKYYSIQPIIKKDNTSNFITRHFNVLCFLSGMISFLLIFLGAMLHYLNLQSEYFFIFDNLYNAGIYWSIVIVLMFLLDTRLMRWLINVIFNTLRKPLQRVFNPKQTFTSESYDIQLGYSMMLFFLVFLVLSMHINKLIIFNRPASLSNNGVLLFVMIISVLHFILYGIRGLLLTFIRQIYILLVILSLQSSLFVFRFIRIRELEITARNTFSRKTLG